jgi:hypothetical protein
MNILETIIIIAVGTLLHFTYEFSHHNKLVAVFSAVNESTWEHIKIAMTPTLLWSLYYGFRYGFTGNYLMAKSLCLLTIILVIPMLFYAYIPFTKKSILIVDIICFCITIICSQLVFHHIVFVSALGSNPQIFTYLSLILLLLELLAYFTLTFHAPKNFLFKDPITHKYGLEGHPCNHHHH